MILDGTSGTQLQQHGQAGGGVTQTCANRVALPSHREAWVDAGIDDVLEDSPTRA